MIIFSVFVKVSRRSQRYRQKKYAVSNRRIAVVDECVENLLTVAARGRDSECGNPRYIYRRPSM